MRRYTQPICARRVHAVKRGETFERAAQCRRLNRTHGGKQARDISLCAQRWRDCSALATESAATRDTATQRAHAGIAMRRLEAHKCFKAPSRAPATMTQRVLTAASAVWCAHRSALYVDLLCPERSATRTERVLMRVYQTRCLFLTNQTQSR